MNDDSAGHSGDRGVAPVSNPAPAGWDTPKPFLRHLEELRRTILGGLLTLGLAMAVSVPLAPTVLRLLRAPLNGIVADPNAFLRSLEITGGFSIALQIVFWSGLLLSAPILLLLIAHFVFPGLTRRERRAATFGFSAAIVLFLCGVVMGYFLALPVGLKVMLQLHGWLGIAAEWTITSYVSFVMRLLLAFGLAFELPIVMAVLGYLGLVSSADLRRYRRHAVVVIMIIAMVLTPGPDVFSQLVMGLPMIVLYELCVWCIRWFERSGGKT